MFTERTDIQILLTTINELYDIGEYSLAKAVAQRIVAVCAIKEKI